MARATTYQRLNLNAVRALLTSPARGTVRDLMKRGLRVESAAKRNLSGIGQSGPKRVDTGRLRASITTVLVSRSGSPAVVVGTNVEYARWVHDGTGLYGPRRRVIRPVSHQFLRFKPKKGRGYVYVRSVKGMKPNPFLRMALAAAKT